jgi:glucosamine-6-phosphate deaminase
MKSDFNTEEYLIDKLEVKIYPDRNILGKSAAKDIHDKMIEIAKTKKDIRMIFAAAPSQNEVLYELSQMDDIPWELVTAFHMDEYIGLHPAAEQLFGNFLKEHLFSKVVFKTVNYIKSDPQNIEDECRRYSGLLNEAPIDIVSLGIGENGHIAFNDPPFADFHDKQKVKVVKLDQISRQQQVNDGCFSSIEFVPEKAITLTIPALLSADSLFTIVPGKSKARAVAESLLGKISESCPASVLRNHSNAKLYLDIDSALFLQQKN